MPQFTLDSSGSVAAVRHAANGQAPLRVEWQDLDAFTRGYIETLFFTEEGQLCEESDGARNIPDVAFNTVTTESHFVGGNSYGFSDIAPETLARIIADCTAFQAKAGVDLAQAYSETDYSEEQAGRDFWFTRNGHGVGFWDRAALDWFSASDKTRKLQDTLTALCGYGSDAAFSNVDAYIGDDGKVYLS